MYSFIKFKKEYKYKYLFMANTDKESDSKSLKESESEPHLSWSSNIDNLLAQWCDHAKCFEWMHTQSFDINYKKARKFVISISLLTAISGLSNVIAGGYSINGFQTAWIFGGVTIMVSTLNMLQDKLGYQQRADLHKRLASQWAIIKGRIEEVVILPPTARKDCRTFLKMLKSDINQVSLEGNSLITEDIRLKCYDKFNKVSNFDVPDICGQVEHTKVYIDTFNLKNNNGNDYIIDPKNNHPINLKITKEV